MKLYGHSRSGNVYKVQLLCSLLGRSYEHEPIEPKSQATRSAEYRRINPNGRVPAIDDDGFTLWESGAILNYLGEGTNFVPSDRRERARMLQWMFFEQYSHEPTVAVSFAATHDLAPGPERDRILAEKRPGAEHALGVMEGHLEGRNWFLGGPSLADIVLYPYTKTAPQCDLPLGPSTTAWLGRVEGLPGFLPRPPTTRK